MPTAIESQIERAVEELLRGKVVDTVPQFRAEVVLKNLAHRVEQDTSARVLLSLMSTEDVARHFHITPDRVRSRAIWLRKRGHRVGWQVPGTRAWLFRPEEMEILKPGPGGRPRKTNSL